jgi:23S rRNA (cytosine1962-C5)-methyltransferase
MRQDELRKHLEHAFAFRSETGGILRLVAGAADALPGMVVDQFGTLGVGTLYDSESSIAAQDLLDALCALKRFGQVLVRARMVDEHDSNRYVYRSSGGFSEDLVLESEEDGIKFKIKTKISDDFGVFPDARRARALVRSISGGKRVLNLFAYTCGFGVAARLGGGTEVVNVDPNRDYLTWGRENAALNGVDFHLIPDTAQAYLRRLNRRVAAGTHAVPDVVVLDPPAFGVGRGAERLVRSLWPELLQLIANLAPRDVVVLCNDRYLRQSVDVMELLRRNFPAYRCDTIAQCPSVLGRQVGMCDRFYFPPQLIHVRRS